MKSARSMPSAAVLADGRVLAAGGYYADPARGSVPAPTLDSSEIWDPATGEWASTGRLGHAQYGASAVTLVDGRVLIVGGSASLETGPIERNSAEVFDPKTGRWSATGTLSEARIGPVLVALADGGALVIGGLVSEPPDEFGVFRHPTTKAERYDPGTGAWSRTSDVPFAAIGQAVVRLADGRLLVAGGDITVNEPDLDPTPPGLTEEAAVYEPTTGKWQFAAPLPRPRSGASAVLLADGSAVLAGGILALRPDDTPSCPIADPQVWRFVPGS
jgi:N-acetylneuraminic acid mutarotase